MCWPCSMIFALFSSTISIPPVDIHTDTIHAHRKPLLLDGAILRDSESRHVWDSKALRHVEMTLLGDEPIIAASTSEGDLLLGRVHLSVCSWDLLQLTDRNGNAWAAGPINMISLSPNGRFLVAIEDNGRFAAIDTLSASGEVFAGWLPYVCSVDPDRADFFSSMWLGDSCVEGLSIQSVKWSSISQTTAIIHYRDGRVLEFDVAGGVAGRLLRPTTWSWTIEHSLPQTIRSQRDTGHRLAKEISRQKSVYFSGKADSTSDVEFEASALLGVMRDGDRLAVIDLQSGCEMRTEHCSTANLARVDGSTVLILEHEADAMKVSTQSLKEVATRRVWRIAHTDVFNQNSTFLCAQISNEQGLRALFVRDNFVTALHLVPDKEAQFRNLVASNPEVVQSSFVPGRVCFAHDFDSCYVFHFPFVSAIPFSEAVCEL